MSTPFLRGLLFAVSQFIFCGAYTQAQNLTDILRMSEQLDKMDRDDFQEYVSKAKSCTRARDFDCANKQVALAVKVANGASEKLVLQETRNGITYELQAVESERQQLIAEDNARKERVRVAEERKRAAEQRAREREAEAEAEAEAYAANNSSAGSGVGMAILQGLNSALADRARIQGIHNQAIANVQNVIAERQRREQEQRDRLNAQQERQRQEQREQRQQAANQQARAQQDQVRIAQAEAEAARGRQEQARREQESARRREEARREALARAEEAKAREIKLEQERQDRIAKQEAEKVAKAKAEGDFLAEVKRQFKLVARTCPGGEGRYYAVGVNPNIKPEIVACYGIQFRAICRDGGISAYGATSHFRSMSTSCFLGESVPMEPKLSCKPEDVQISVTEVTPCF